MGVMVWWVPPLTATLVAILWTAVIRRRQQRRADPAWRASRLAAKGQVLSDGESADVMAPDGPAAGLAPRPRRVRATRASATDV